MNAEQREAMLDAVYLLAAVDNYLNLPSYGRGKQYAALARKLRELVDKDDTDHKNMKED